MENSTLILLIIVSSIILFFILRPIYLWYFNINKITDYQKEQKELLNKNNQLLEKLYIQMGGKIENDIDIKQNNDVDNQEFEKIQQLKNEIKENEVVVKIIQNGKIEKWKKSDWEDVVKLGNE